MIKEITINNINLLNNSFLNIKFIQNELKHNPYAKVIIYIDNIIKGYLYYSEIYDRIEINQLEVIPLYRRKKIGSLLLEEVIKQNKDITLEVKIDNSSAINLYKKYGFNKVSIRKGYYNGIDGILMERKK